MYRSHKLLIDQMRDQIFVISMEFSAVNRRCPSRETPHGQGANSAVNNEADVPTGKVGGSLLFERLWRELPRGVWGHAPQKILKFRCLEM